jgi:hypothetical protein
MISLTRHHTVIFMAHMPSPEPDQGTPPTPPPEVPPPEVPPEIIDPPLPHQIEPIRDPLVVPGKNV